MGDQSTSGEAGKARRLFASYLERLHQGERPDFDALCADHPELSEELRGLQDLYAVVQQVVGHPASLADRIAEAFGSHVDPQVTIEAESTSEVAVPEEILTRLAGRTQAFGRYRLKGEIAKGGQGAVLRVWDEDLRRNLAMKVILGKGAPPSSGATPPEDTRTLLRFLEEAQVTGQLDHPGIVPVHELGLDRDGRVYFTMKLVKGRDLRHVFELVNESLEGWNQTRALGVLLKVCEAMAYAHSKGVIHRDLKPANVMVGRFGEVYVMDWGLAHVLGREEVKDIRLREAPLTSEISSERQDLVHDSPDAPLITMDGDVVGTPCYMSPEQAEGRLQDMGPHSDVYSLGAMLYHLLTGRMPYIRPGANVSPRTVLAALLGGPPEPARVLAPDAPPELLAICEKAMARDSRVRYRDTGALAEELRAFLERRVVAAYEAGPIAELRSWVRRNKGVAATAAAALVVVVALSTIGFQRIRVERNKAIANGERAKENATLADARAAQAEQATYVSRLLAASSAIDAGNVGVAKNVLAGCPPNRRGWEWRYLQIASDPSFRTLEAEGHTTRTASFSLDGSRVVSVALGGDVRVFDTSSGDVIGQWQAPADALQQSWPSGTVQVGSAQAPPALQQNPPWIGADRQTVVFFSWWQGRWTADVLDLITGQPREVHTFEGSSGDVNLCAAMSADGTRLAVAWIEGPVRVWKVGSNKDPKVLTGLPRFDSALAVDSSGATVVFDGPSARAQVVDVATGALIRELAQDVSISVVAISTDGLVATGGEGHERIRQILRSENDGSIRLWDPRVEEPLLHVIDGKGYSVSSLAFSPDGRSLLAATGDGELRRIDVRSGLVLSTIGTGSNVTGVSFSADGRAFLAVCSGEVRLYDVATSTKGVCVRATPSGLLCMSVSPDGQVVAAGGMDTAIRIYDARTGDGLGILRGHRRVVTSVAFDAHGRRLASVDGEDLVPMGKSVMHVNSPPTVRIWDLETRACLRTIPVEGRSLLSVCFVSEDEIAAGGEDKSGQGMLQVFDATSGAQIGSLEGHRGPVNQVALDPTRTRLASGSQKGELKLWEVASWTCLRTIPTGVTALAWSADGRLASGGWDRKVSVWDAADGREVVSLDGQPSMLGSLAWSPDGTRIVSGGGAGDDPVVRVHDSTMGDLVLQLEGHEADVTGVSLLPGGARLISCSRDGTLRFWDGDFESARQIWNADDDRHAVQPLVDSLFAKEILTERVILRLEAEPGLSSVERDAAIRLARSRGDPSDGDLRHAAERILYSPDQTQDDYALALRITEVLAERGKSGSFLTLPALYRVGRYKDGLDLITKAELELDAQEGVPPAGRMGLRLFSSLFYARLGDIETARERFRDGFIVIVDAKSDDDPFFREAIDLIWSGSLPEAYKAAMDAVREARERERNPDLGWGSQRSFVAAASRMHGDPDLSAEAVELALRTLVALHPNEANRECWAIVSDPAASAQALDPAVEVAEALCSVEPKSNHYLNTLGVGLYRAGRFDEAIETLTRASEINRHAAEPYPPANDLVFIAMSQQHMGRVEQARAALAEARALVTDTTDAELLGFVREAESLIEPTAGSPAQSPER